LRIPPLGAYGIQSDNVPALVESAAKASSMKGNPIALTTDEMAEILTRAI
jgi:alcohol dehydrogenase class IV